MEASEQGVWSRTDFRLDRSYFEMITQDILFLCKSLWLFTKFHRCFVDNSQW